MIPKVFPMPPWLLGAAEELKEHFRAATATVDAYKRKPATVTVTSNRYLEQALAAPDPMAYRTGLTYGDFIGTEELQLIPDIARVASKNLKQLIHLKYDTIIGPISQVILRNLAAYRAEESGMGWHHNGDSPGLRVYLVFNTTHDSVFRYYSTETGPEPVDIVEPWGWHIKVFNIPAGEPYFWHTIRAGGPRYSVGYRIRGMSP